MGALVHGSDGQRLRGVGGSKRPDRSDCGVLPWPDWLRVTTCSSGTACPLTHFGEVLLCVLEPPLDRSHAPLSGTKPGYFEACTDTEDQRLGPLQVLIGGSVLPRIDLPLAQVEQAACLLQGITTLREVLRGLLVAANRSGPVAGVICQVGVDESLPSDSATTLHIAQRANRLVPHLDDFVGVAEFLEVGETQKELPTEESPLLWSGESAERAPNLVDLTDGSPADPHLRQAEQ